MKIKKIKEIINHNNPGLPPEEVNEIAITIHKLHQKELWKMQEETAIMLHKDHRGEIMDMQRSKNKIIKIQKYNHMKKLKDIKEEAEKICEDSKENLYKLTQKLRALKQRLEPLLEVYEMFKHVDRAVYPVEVFSIANVKTMWQAIKTLAEEK